jgi:hypothetical protein
MFSATNDESFNGSFDLPPLNLNDLGRQVWKYK